MQKSKLSNLESFIGADLSLYKAIRHRTGKMFLIHQDGGLSIVMSIQGINATSFSEDEYSSIFSAISRTVDSINTDLISFQFVNCKLQSRKRIDTSELPEYLKPRGDYYNRLADKNLIFDHKYYFSIYHAPVKQSAKETIKSWIAKLTGKETSEVIKNSNKSMTDMDSRARITSEIAEQFHAVFKKLGFQPEYLDTKEANYNMIQDFVRPTRSKYEYIKINDAIEEPRAALFSGQRQSEKLDDFVLDDVYHRVYTLDRPPTDVIFGRSAWKLREIDYEYIYSISFNPMNHKKAVETFNWKVKEKLIMQDANSHGSRVPDLQGEKDLGRILNAYQSFIQGRSKAVKCAINMAVRVPQKEIEAEMAADGSTFGEWKRSLDAKLINGLFPEFGKSEWGVENYTSYAVFNRMIPGFGHMNSIVLKEMMLLSDNVPYFMAPWSTSSGVHHNGANHFFDEDGGIIPFDIMDPRLPAWNYNVSGETGSGKSVLINAILAMQYAEFHKTKPPVICIIDASGARGSYTKFLALSKGEIINLSRTRKPSIQIFEIVPGMSVPTRSKIESLIVTLQGRGLEKTFDELYRDINSFYIDILDKGHELTDLFYAQKFEEIIGIKLNDQLKELFTLKPGECQPEGKTLALIMSVLEVMLSEDHEKMDGFKLHNQSDILEIVRQTYNSTADRFPYMSDFYEKCKELMTEDSESVTLFTKIKNYTKYGSYPMFDAETNVNLNADTIFVDVKGMDSEPFLQMIYALLFNNLFSNKMYSIRGRRKLLVRDEAWSIMKSEKARRYLVDDLRTARKTGFATLTISQFPTDFLEPSRSDGQAILGNTQVFIIGKIAFKGIVDQVVNQLSIPPNLASELSHLGNIKDHKGKTLYSRFLVKSGESYHVIRNYLDPFEYFLYSSSEGDNLIIDFYSQKTDRFANLMEVLKYIANGSHKGDKELIKHLESSGYKTLADSLVTK